MNGVHWSNSLWTVDEADFGKVAPFDTVLVIIAAFGGQQQHLERQYRLCERLQDMGKRLVFRIESRGWQDVAAFTEKWASIINSLQPFGQDFQLNNEPNHKGEFFGGSDYNVADRYNDYFQQLVTALRPLTPGARYGFPGLAVQQNEVNWWLACRDAIQAGDWVGCHIYWQGENYDDPAWGRRYALLREITDKPIIITEYGDSTPGRSIEDKAQRYKIWREKLPSYVEAECCYLLSSPNQEWQEFVLNDKAIEIISSANRKELSLPDNLETVLANMWERQGVSVNPDDGFFKHAVYQARTNGVFIIPQPSADGNYTTDLDGFRIAYCYPPMYCKIGDWGNVKTGLPFA